MVVCVTRPSCRRTPVPKRWVGERCTRGRRAAPGAEPRQASRAAAPDGGHAGGAGDLRRRVSAVSASARRPALLRRRGRPVGRPARPGGRAAGARLAADRRPHPGRPPPLLPRRPRTSRSPPGAASTRRSISRRSTAARPAGYLLGQHRHPGLRLDAPDQRASHILAVSSHGQPFSYFSWAYSVPTDGSPGGQLPWGPVSDIAVADFDGERRTLLLTGKPPHEPAAWKRYRGGATGRLWLHGKRLLPDLRRAPGLGDVRRRPDRLPLRPRGHRQPLLLPARRHRPAPPHRPRRLLRPARLQRRLARRLPVRRRPVAGRRPVARTPCRAGWTCGSAARAPGGAPTRCRPPRTSTSLAVDTTGRASAVVRTRQPVLAHPPRRPRPHDPRTPRAYGSGCPRCSAPPAGSPTSRTRRARTPSRSPTCRGRAAPGEPRRLAAGELGRVQELASAPGRRAARGRLERRPAAARGRGPAGGGGGEEDRSGNPGIRDEAVGTRSGVTELIRSVNGPVRDLAFSPDSALADLVPPGHRPLPAADQDGPAGRPARSSTSPTAASRTSSRSSPATAAIWRSCPGAASTRSTTCTPATCPSRWAAAPTSYRCPPRPPPPSRCPPRDGPRRAVWTRTTTPAAGGRRGPVTGGGGGAGEPGHAVPGGGVQVLLAVAGQRRRPGLAALADLRRAGRDLRQPGRHLGPAHPRTLRPRPRRRRTELTSTWTGSRSAATAPGWSSTTRASCARSPPPSRPTATRRSTSTCGASCTRSTRRRSGARRTRRRAGIIRAYFWEPEMCGIDWDAVLDQYRPLVERVASPDEFADLLREVLGELGTSHAYVAAARRNEGPPHYQRAMGLLGANLVRRGRAVGGHPHPARRVLRLQGPLPAGRYGHPRGRGRSPMSTAARWTRWPARTRCWPRAGGTTVELTFAPPEGDGPPRRVAVVPLIDERPLRYQDWVAKRRAVVRELSGGRCGYLHIPDMGGSGWAQFNRDLRMEVVPARADRGRTRQRGRPHQRAGRREADPHDPRLGPDPQRPAGLVRLQRAARPGRRARRRGDLLRRRHDHRGLQAAGPRPGGRACAPGAAWSA